MNTFCPAGIDDVRRLRLLSIGRRRPPSDVAAGLGVAAHRRSVVVRDYVEGVDGQPRVRMTTYAPHTTPAPAEERQEERHLDDRGPATRSTMRDVTIARLPTTAERKILRIPTGVPVIDRLRVVVGPDGVALEATRLVARGDASPVAYDILMD